MQNLKVIKCEYTTETQQVYIYVMYILWSIYSLQKYVVLLSLIYNFKEIFSNSS